MKYAYVYSRMVDVDRQPDCIFHGRHQPAVFITPFVGGVDNSVHKQTVCRSHRKQLICNFRINFVAQIRVRRACILSLDMNTIFFEGQQKERNKYAYYVGYQNTQAMRAIARNLDFMFSIHFFLSFYCICLVKKRRQQDKGLC